MNKLNLKCIYIEIFKLSEINVQVVSSEEANLYMPMLMHFHFVLSDLV